MTSEYALAGVDPSKIGPFKAAMLAMGKQTTGFPLRWGVRVDADGSYRYVGNYRRHRWGKPVLEGLGNKGWIAEWMYQFDGSGQPRFFPSIALDTAMMAVGDILVSGARPVICNDEVAAADSEWFSDVSRANAFAAGFYEACKQSGMALVGGESPALKYLVKAEPPVSSAPLFSCSVTGIIAPIGNRITGKKLRAGDRIIGIGASGVHANGISLLIKRIMAQPEAFLTKLPSGITVGEEILKPTRCYVNLVDALQREGIRIHKLQPGTGGGVAKVAADHRPFTYRIEKWPELPEIYGYLLKLGVSLKDILTTFNCGIGYFVFVPEDDALGAVAIANKAGYYALDLGRVEEGHRHVIYEPVRGMVLDAPPE